jgi:methionine-rich copper-binding protein CopC
VKIKTIAACIIAAVTLTTARDAHAHARLLKSFPADKAELKAAPAQAELWFNELLDDNFNTIEIYPAAELVKKEHTNFATAAPLVDAKDRTHLTVAVASLKPGDYVLEYRVLSRDGHTAPGRFNFRVLEAK